MANGEAGQVFWTVRFRSEGDPAYVQDEQGLGGKFPTKAEADAHLPFVLSERRTAYPDVNQEAVCTLVACGHPLLDA